MDRSRLTRRETVFLVIVVVLFSAVGIRWVSTRSIAVPEAVEGWAMPNAKGTAISLHASADDPAGEGYVIAGARWAGVDGSWHGGGGGPTCVGTDTGAKTHVRLGVVDVDTGGASWRHVVWLRCLERPRPAG
ncbi:hypothetical protein [Saccharomonospora cyanea]|uniref:Uncharacterized protein n=1 Tax=Saccharomonospora cyanea NA-134 TaxID=882082 RepID=H5XNA9_9PSEU|nr:hypothetical protein [Saccharomonospora cyanea]EHR63742.1 hypothetical protein SaccyDRAFT_4947 [Saccharomonospora cyanea NA-134]